MALAAVIVTAPGVALADATFSATLDASTTQEARIGRDGTPSTCGTAKTYPGQLGSGPRAYDSYSVVNNSGSPQCYTVTLSSAAGSELIAVAYLGTFNPAAIGAGYLGDAGASDTTRTFGVDVPAGATLTVVITDVNDAAGGQAYTLDIAGQMEPAPPPIPTLSEWAMILFGGLLAGGAALGLQRRRVLG